MPGRAQHRHGRIGRAGISLAHRHPPRHPQQNGNSAQIAAAAWLGFANPNPCRTTSPTTKSTTHQPSAALDGLKHLLSYKYGLRPSIVAHLKNSLFHIATCLHYLGIILLLFRSQ